MTVSLSYGPVHMSFELVQVLSVLVHVGKSWTLAEIKTQLVLDEKVVEQALSEGLSREVIESYVQGGQNFYMRKDTHVQTKLPQPEGKIFHVGV